MTTTTIDAGSAAASRTECAPSTGLGRLIERVTARRRRTTAKRRLRALSPEQLRDAGIDAAEVFRGPILHVDATTMTRLMSMR